MPRYEWTPEEEAVVLHILEKVVVDQKGTTREAFAQAAKDPLLEKHGRTAGGVKYHWNQKLRKQATGRLEEWVKANAVYSGRDFKSLPNKVKQSSRRAQILQLLNMASDELDTIDGKQRDAMEQVKMLANRKVELNKNMRLLIKELEEITTVNEDESQVDVQTIVESTKNNSSKQK